MAKTHTQMLEQMAKNGDDSLVRAKDLPLFWKVKDFLKEQGLNYEIRGSATNGSRQYGDIDIFVYAKPEEPRNASFNLAMQHVTGTGDLAGYITGHNQAHLRYMNDNIEHRFALEDGKTKIDLAFQSNHVDAGFSFSDIPELPSGANPFIDFNIRKSDK